MKQNANKKYFCSFSSLIVFCRKLGMIVINFVSDVCFQISFKDFVNSTKKIIQIRSGKQWSYLKNTLYSIYHLGHKSRFTALYLVTFKS